VYAILYFRIGARGSISWDVKIKYVTDTKNDIRIYFIICYVFFLVLFFFERIFSSKRKVRCARYRRLVAYTGRRFPIGSYTKRKRKTERKERISDFRVVRSPDKRTLHNIVCSVLCTSRIPCSTRPTSLRTVRMKSILRRGCFPFYFFDETDK